MSTTTAPWTSVRQLVVALTGHVLDDLDPTADLSDVGVDSLAAMELLLAAEDDIGRAVALEAMASLRTIGDLLGLLDALQERTS